jgi:mersacidin/lichenicidin family type 2 lantibiotic
MNERIIKAWKNEQFRATLTPSERAALPANPAGTIGILDDDDLGAVDGARTEWIPIFSWGCCDGFTGEACPSIKCENDPLAPTTSETTCGYACAKAG